MTGFKAFILRGNLVELAVAFIMAASFAAVVTSFTNVIMSVISKVIGGNPDFSAVTWGGVPVGAFFTALIAFLILAVVVYFGVVLPYTKAKERYFPTPPEEPEGTPEDIALLTQIRDALVAQGGGSTTTPPPTV
jgi:large conductance mechanosensitive channel